MTTEKEMQARMLAASLTGIIMGFMKHYDNIPVNVKIMILRNIQKAHVENPIPSSEDVIGECEHVINSFDEVSH